MQQRERELAIKQLARIEAPLFFEQLLDHRRRQQLRLLLVARQRRLENCGHSRVATPASARRAARLDNRV